ncbi:hypothetical protein BGL38_06600 [Fructilactobacillus sanfranciscensis]|nr:hypothetical protein BGL38_06600 [Fructilactobacillus sanfranciscensis]
MKKLFISYWKYLLDGFLMFLIVFRLGAVLKDNWLMILIEIITGMISYLVFILLLRPNLIKVTLLKLKNRNNKD